MDKFEQAAHIVEALEYQAADYRSRFRLPKDHRFTAVFPHNETIGRDTFEIAATALNARGIDVDWSMWPPRDAPEWQREAWNTSPLGEADKRRHETVDVLLYPKDSLQAEPAERIDLTAAWQSAAQNIRDRHRLQPFCCHLHNHNCEPPSELCCEMCTEVHHVLDHEPCIWLTCPCQQCDKTRSGQANRVQP